MPEPAQSLVGQILANTYRVEALIGKGGMSAVYSAVHLRLPTKVAIKVLHAEIAANTEIFARFRREAEITSGLKHPNIVQVLDFNRLSDGTPYLMMEFLDGEDLHGRLHRQRTLPFDEVLALCRAVGGGLTAAHKRDVVHRDLKPQNIFLARHDQGDEIIEIPKIVDFGISKIRHAVTDTQQTRDQQLLGTPNYMSPEQARGHNSEVDHRTDQWALAAIAYVCLTGRLAFPGDTLASIVYQVVVENPPPVRSLAPAVPEYAEQAIARALSKERDRRFASINDFLRALAGQPLDSKSSSRVPAVGGHSANTPNPTTPATPAGGRTPLPLTPRPATDPRAPAIPLTPLPPGGSSGSLTQAGGQVSSAIFHPRRRLLAASLGTAVGAAVVFSWLMLREPRLKDVSPPPGDAHTPAAAADLAEKAAPAEDLVTVKVLASPRDATVLVGDRLLPPEGVVRLRRAKDKLVIVATAPGHLEQRRTLVPSADQTIELTLQQVPAPAPDTRDEKGTKGDHEHPHHREPHEPHDPGRPPPKSDADNVDIDISNKPPDPRPARPPNPASR